MSTVLAALGTIGVAVIALLITGRAAKAAETSAAAAETSATASQAAADAAKSLAHIETERRHDDLRPDVEISLGRQHEVGNSDRAWVYADIKNRGDRDYRCRPIAVFHSGEEKPSRWQERVGAGTTRRFHVLDMRVDQDPLPRYVEFEFEPDGWDCPCDRSGERHWLRRVESEQIPFTE